jgi:hypothetical protein
LLFYFDLAEAKAKAEPQVKVEAVMEAKVVSVTNLES